MRHMGHINAIQNSGVCNKIEGEDFPVAVDRYVSHTPHHMGQLGVFLPAIEDRGRNRGIRVNMIATLLESSSGIVELFKLRRSSLSSRRVLPGLPF